MGGGGVPGGQIDLIGPADAVGQGLHVHALFGHLHLLAPADRLDLPGLAPPQQPLPLPLAALREEPRRRPNQNRKSKKSRRSLRRKSSRRHRPNQPARKSAKKSDSFNCRQRARNLHVAVEKPVQSNLRRRLRAHRDEPIPDNHFNGSPAVANPRRHRASSRNRRPHRSPNLSRPQAAKSSSSSRRLSCANSPRN